MRSKTIIGICLTSFLISMLVSTLKIGPVRAQAVELSYDDREADAGVSDLANKTYGWGVRFDHPETGKSYQVQSAEIYIYLITGIEEGRLRIFIYLYQPSIAKYEKLVETVVSGFSQGWNTIDLTSYDIVVDQNFIIGVNWVIDYILHVGDDHDTQCHSGGFNTTDITDFDHYAGRNFMIRAFVIQVIPGDVNFDGIVDINDVVIAAVAFGSATEDNPETPWDETENWNPDADLYPDGIIDIFDLVIIGVNFGKTW